MQSLYDRLGGQDAVDSVVETFYRKVLTDDRISQFFDDTDMDQQIAKQKSFLTFAFGGPANYSGLNMKEGHKHLVAKGLNYKHVDAVIELLGATLQELKVPNNLIGEAAAIAESVRSQVLGR